MTTGRTGDGDTTASRHLYSIEYDDGDGTLTPLRGQSIVDLYRSFAIGGIVAYIGSGNSYLLGYPTWDALADSLLDEVIAEGEGILPDALLRAYKAAKDAKNSKLDKYERLAIAAEIIRTASKSIDSNGKFLDWLSKLHDKYREMFDFQVPMKKNRADEILSALQQSRLPASAEKAKALESCLGQYQHLPIDFNAGLEWIQNLTGEQRKPRRRKSPKKIDLLDSAAPTIDILGTLRRDWRISRYATLNYDIEIERMLEQGDYPFYTLTRDDDREPDLSTRRKEISGPSMESDSSQKDARSRLGERARSVDLAPGNMAELMLFAADSPAGVSQVLHLHGSMRQPEHMIVTASDYNRRYYASAAWVDMLNNGQELLYRANAILFIGVGMSEEVLLRAFRILSQAPDREMRPVYALMESKGVAKDTASAIMQFQQYGIRTIFFGASMEPYESAGEVSAGDHPLIISVHSEAKRRDANISGMRLASLSDEIDFLDKLDSFISGEKYDQAQIDSLFCDIEMKGGGLDLTKLPRLMTTSWHSLIFDLICSSINTDEGRLVTLAQADQIDAMRKCVAYLKTAIRTRALHDEIVFLSRSAISWKYRWRDIPRSSLNHGCDGASNFRSVSMAKSNGNRKVHNVSIRRGEGFERKKKRIRRPRKSQGSLQSMTDMLDIYLRDSTGEKAYMELKGRISETDGLTVVRVPPGGGKGIVATMFAHPPEDESASDKWNQEEVADRIVISFGQSCSRDSSLDLIAKWIVPSTLGHNELRIGRRLELILSQTDLLITLSEARPKLAEWEALLHLLAANTSIRTLALCENKITRDAFGEIWALPGRDVKCLAAVGSPIRKPCTANKIMADPSRTDHASKLMEIAYQSHCVWATSFLCGLQVLMKKDYKIEGDRESEFYDELILRIGHALNTTQDPRQRVPAIIDVALSRIEHYVTTHRDVDSRRDKVIAHAILKHLFAFGGPVGKSVFEACPELSAINKQYPNEKKTLQQEIAQVLQGLEEIDLVKPLSQCYSDEPRYGLHGHVRNYLSVKKGLPFSVVSGREQTALTLIPVIDDEVVPLEREDYRFIWETVDGLLDHPNPENYSQRVRAAYMLLRGSMRIGTVLRASRNIMGEQDTSRTPLDDYFKRLLAVRCAVLVSNEIDLGSPKDSSLPPIYEREWVWIFNEMGVVNLLRGEAHDAIAFFEQAYEFEVARLRRGDCYEALLYKDKPVRDFSIARCRILLNMAQAEIERGAFDRSRRILESVERDFESVGSLFMKTKAKGAGTESPDRHAEELCSAQARARFDERRDFQPPDDSRSEPGECMFAEEPDRTRRGGQCDGNGGHEAVAKKLMHREVRIILLSAGLIKARLDYLSGGAAKATDWLDKHRDAIVEEGMHGLTALYFQIQGDVELRRKRPQKARERFAVARAEAEASGRGDLIFSVMLGEVECDLESMRLGGEVRLQQHLAKISKIKHEAKRMGMARIVATASIIRARIYLGFGEYRSARQDLMTALTISMSRGLNIKRVSALTVLAAQVGLMDNEMSDEARKIAAAAQYEAERMGYKLAAAHAKDLELVLREQGSIEEWALRLSKGSSPDEHLSQ